MLALEPAFDAEVRVVDGTGAPVEGVELVAHPTGTMARGGVHARPGEAAGDVRPRRPPPRDLEPGAAGADGREAEREVVVPVGAEAVPVVLRLD